MPGERTSVYLTSGLAAAVTASGTPLAELIRRGLVGGTAEAAQPAMSDPADVDDLRAQLRMPGSPLRRGAEGEAGQPR